MDILIFLLLTLVWLIVGNRISKRNYNDGWLIITGVGISCISLWLFIHICVMINVPYAFENWVVQRNAFEKTLKDSRENGNKFETATIVKEVAEWNQNLAKYKYENTLWIYDWCIDDRINNLKPIK